jgi:hypothetical protein
MAGMERPPQGADHSSLTKESLDDDSVLHYTPAQLYHHEVD